MNGLSEADREYHDSPEDLESSGKVIGNLVFDQRQSKQQQLTNEQTWIGECTEALEDCTAIASRLESDPWGGRCRRR